MMNDLPDFPFASHFQPISSGLRVHYIDEGPRDAPVVLMMHGEPSWCYLWRHMIGPVRDRGLRVVAPDLIGFGLSSKPGSRSACSYAAQVGWMRELVEALDLRHVTLACQDWGSLVGLRLVAEMPERFSAVVLSNGGLPAGEKPPLAFTLWRAFAKFSPLFPIGRIIQAGVKRRLSRAEIAAYELPFPDRASKLAARSFPLLVPFGNDVAVADQRGAWEVLERWEKPFLCCFSDGDPITRGGDRPFLARVPGARNQPHVMLHGGHFIQDDDPAGFVEQILRIAGPPSGLRA